MADEQAAHAFACEAIDISAGLKLANGCINCGNEKRSQHGNARYCETCRDAKRRLHGRSADARRVGKRDRRGEVWKKAPAFQCLGCGAEFRPKRTDRKKYCSRGCALANAKQWHRHPKRERTLWPSSKVRFLPCKICSSLFTSKKGSLYCSAPCAAGYTRPCTRCGTLHTRRRSQFCTDRCKSIARCEADRKARKANKFYRVLRKAKGRATYHGVTYEPLNPLRVFERDSWSCQVCGTRTPKRLRGTYHPKAPELDHRIPMAMGGGHTWSNVQCCCRSCNLAKGGHTIAGQMPLPL